MKKIIIPIALILFAPLTVLSTGDETNCDFITMAEIGVHHDYDAGCYLSHIYKQNQVLIQEQNQTNVLLAEEICTHEFGSLDINDNLFDKNAHDLLGGNRPNTGYLLLHECMQKVLNDVK